MTDQELQALVDEFKTIAIAELYIEAERQTLSLRKYIMQQVRAGTDPNELKAVLIRDLNEGGQIFGSFRSQFKATVKNEVSNVNRKVHYAIQRENGMELLSWTLDPGKKHCEDCLSRADMPSRTMKEWQIIGVPEAGVTICGDKCGCRLLPDGIYTNAEVDEANQIYMKEKS